MSSFKLSGPVFGGRKGQSLVVRYRLKEAGTAELRLMRGKKTVKRLHGTRSRVAGRTYRIKLKPRRLKRALYTVRLVVKTTDGRRQTLKLKTRRL